MHPNEERVRKLYEVGLTNPARFSLFAADFVNHIGGDAPFAGDWTVADLTHRWIELEQSGWPFATKMDFDLVSVLATDSHAVSLHRWRAERRGVSIEQHNFNVYRFDADGLIAERWEFVEDQAAHDRFWS